MNQHTISPADQSRPKDLVFETGVQSEPYLADHGFQDMVVLPGTFYIDRALRLDRQHSNVAAGLVRNAVFSSPIILSTKDSIVNVEVKDRGNGCVEYAFYEAGIANGGTGSSDKQYAAKVQIERNSPEVVFDNSVVFPIEPFQARSQTLIEAKEFYGALRQNGNQYGPSFQKVSQVWRSEKEVLGRLDLKGQRQLGELHCLHPVLLDSAMQLMAPFIMGSGRTFVLRSVDEIRIESHDFPDSLWGHAILSTPAGEGSQHIVGEVRVFDDAGRQLLALSGITLMLLGRDDPEDRKAPLDLVITSNFTAEPLEDSLNFWAEQMDVAIRAQFAPYNQVFQQLLDTGSEFHGNREGVNVILLALEQWAKGDPASPMKIDKDRMERCFGKRTRYLLPNGLEIVHLNRYETEYVYKEIFEDQCYLKHGIRLRDGDTVVDIGANIGLFSLFVMSRCANATIYACEPAPLVYDLLKANCTAYGTHVYPLNVGVSDRKKTATFTFYEKSSVFSGFHSDVAEDREAVQAIVRNMLSGVSGSKDSIEDYVQELTADRLDRKTYECQLTSISDIIRENKIDRIHLLKVDAEKSELDIIRGIEDGDWPKIDQIAMEIHDPTRRTIKLVEELLAGKGYFCAVEQETLLERSGLFNLYATREPMAGGKFAALEDHGASGGVNGRVQQKAESLRRTEGEFCGALRSFSGRSNAPLVLCLCPSSPTTAADGALSALLAESEASLLSEVAKLPNVHVVGAEMLRRYPVKDYYDPESYQVAHIPYTQDFYAAVGTGLTRAIYNLKSSPFKVIVLDADNTLWKGVCGEDGPLGIEISEPYRVLQEFMLDRMKAGMLLCLCSKNNDKDVQDVFDQRNDMLLKREHLVASRVNWDRKSENIRSLAKELNLGLDSFIFIDDNPVECADVRINCPGVLALQLPEHAESIPAFLDHVWAFDHRGATKEDQKRTQMYMESAKRERYREQSLSLKDFIKGLQIRTEISEPKEEQLDRVSQLTFRTNQFNLTTIRRSKGEIQQLLGRDDVHCMIVNVADRFGDYGLVGVLIYEVRPDRFKVDTFLMSCRVLGRGVEHSLLARLGQWAIRDGKQFVEFTYVPTDKNSLVLDFIASIEGQYRSKTDTSWSFPADYLAGIEYDPDAKAPTEPVRPEVDGPEKSPARSALPFDAADRSERLQRIGESFHTVGSVSKAIEDFRRGRQPGGALVEARPGNALETALLGIWRRILGRPRIGLNDNFFEAGGTSLRAVQVIAAIKKELNQALSIVSLFECPTVVLLAARLSEPQGEANAVKTAAAASSRGQQRRYNTNRRKNS